MLLPIVQVGVSDAEGRMTKAGNWDGWVREQAVTTLDHPRIGAAYSNEFYRQVRNRVANVRELAAEIMDLDPSEGEEFFAEYQLKAGDLRLQMDALDKLFESEMYARLPPTSAGPK